MPPAYVQDRPDPKEVESLVGWIDTTFGRLDERRATTLRRLNRREFEHAILDLVGVAVPLDAGYPADDVGSGFDVVGSTLTISPNRLERLIETAERIAAMALPPPAQRLARQTIEAADFETGKGNRYEERYGIVAMTSNGSVETELVLDGSGTYRLEVLASERPAGDQHARLRLLVDDRVLEELDVNATAEPALWVVRAELEAGPHRLRAAFVNDYYNPESENPDDRDRNLYLTRIDVVGPEGDPRRTVFEERLGPRERPLVETVAELAQLFWRGPVAPADVDALLQLVADDGPRETALRPVLTALIASPRFLFRPEPTVSAREDVGALGSRPLSSPELATRMAAFLWSSVPDRQLLEADLLEPPVRRGQTARLLRDARSSRLARAFASQWLQLTRLDEHRPDPVRFSSYDEELRAAMQLEAELLFETVLRERRPLAELLRTDFTFVNEALAEHYGLAGVRGPELRRVPIPDAMQGRRGGVLGLAGALTATSNPVRTSPVLRGKWVLEALLATPPAAPPPGVDSLPEQAAGSSALSIRERLEQHRADPACAVCHEPMDGLGFALENFDAVGRWRESDGGRAVDATGELPGGIRLEGPDELANYLLTDSRFRLGLLRHLAVFALGRALTSDDRAAVSDLARSLGPDATLVDAIGGVVELEAFRTRYALGS